MTCTKYWEVPQSLHKIIPSTTLYYKAYKVLRVATFYYTACTNHFQHAKFMQPLQCLVQPRLPKHHVTAKRRNAQNTLNQHFPFIAGCSHFTASSPKQAPCNIHAATTTRSAAPRTHSCSQYIAIGIHTLQNTKGEPITRWNDPSRTRRTQEVSFIAGCSHSTRKNRRFRAPASSPTQLTQLSCSHYNHHFPKSPHSLRHHFPRSPHSLRHHFPRSPHSLRDHFPRSPHSLRRHFPKSPLPFVTTYPTHHFHHPSSCTVVWCKVSQFYLSVTWKIASQLTLTIILYRYD